MGLQDERGGDKECERLFLIDIVLDESKSCIRLESCCINSTRLMLKSKYQATLRIAHLLDSEIIEMFAMCQYRNKNSTLDSGPCFTCH